jgi:hypothetical protein
MKYIKLFLVLLASMLFSACHYLDIVPDNVATVDNAFDLRSQAKKYLYTCYSFLPKLGDWAQNPGLLSGDEIWFYYPYSMYINPPPDNWEIARGDQNKLNPYLDYWDGTRGGMPLFQAIRDCNTFLANIGKVPDIENYERARWISEVTFLKAYYNWFLLRMYGPIPILDKNLPVSSGAEKVKFHRQPVDSCFQYIVGLIDSSLADLPLRIDNPVSEMGRITQPIALSIKARILMSAASPLFNGNQDYAHFVDNKGTQLFNTTYDPAKWKEAMDACKEAIDMCQQQGYQLYHFNSAVQSLSPEIQTQMDIRNAICEKWNSEIIWGSTNSMLGVVQRFAQAQLDPSLDYSSTAKAHGEYAPTLKVAEMFYTRHGVPIDEDNSWDYDNRYQLITATSENKYYLEPGYTTSYLNLDREPRYYADLGFDGGKWYGQGRYDDDNMFHVEGRVGQYSGKSRSSNYSITGYYAKKLVNYLNTPEAPSGSYSYESYPFPVMRLADLYLLYAEAVNEVEGPTSEALTYINLVRERAGIPGVEEAWSQYSKRPDEYKTKDGFRKIIHRERLIEMAFEGNRYWDLRRWKEAQQSFNEPVKGRDIQQQDPQTYYQPQILFQPNFKKKDYFWPIDDNDIIKNGNLVQNPGW